MALQTHMTSLCAIYICAGARFIISNLHHRLAVRSWELIVWVFVWQTNMPTFATEEYPIHLFTSRFYHGRNLRIQGLIGSAVHSVQ